MLFRSLFYFAPDGKKYLAAACNAPLLYSNPKNLQFGFDIDNSAASTNPLGLNPTNPYKGQPIKGSLTIPVSVGAVASKAKRLAEVAAAVASGGLVIKNSAGGLLPVAPTVPSYLENIKSEFEMMNDMLSGGSGEFEKKLIDLHSMLNRQLDKLGEMQTTAINSLRKKVRDARSSGVDEAEKEKDLAKKRKAKKAARSLSPVTIDEKISSVIDAFNTHIEIGRAHV